MTTTPATAWEGMVDEAMRACVGVFGEGQDSEGNPRVVYLHVPGGVAYTLEGIFEALTEQVDPDTGVVILSHQPTLSGPLSAFQQLPAQGDSAVVRGKSYRVVEPIFDGQGTVTLRLREA